MVDNPDIYIHAPLIDECRKGSRKAQYRLYDQYSKAMFNLAFRILNNREDAEDILQEGFVECFRNIASFRFESTFGAWLKKIIINKCINHIKKKKIDLTLCETLPPVVVEEEEEVIYDTEKVFKGIEHLPDGYRIILKPSGSNSILLNIFPVSYLTSSSSSSMTAGKVSHKVRSIFFFLI